jgi:hypothetical protein
MERRFVEQGSIEAGDIWFFEAPEVIDLARALPEPPDAALVAKVRNRRRGFEQEARLGDGTSSPADDEDDYY